MIDKHASKKLKNVIGIRTNTWGIQEEEQYNKLLQYFSPEEIFIIIDYTQKRTFIPDKFNAVILDVDFIENNGLLNWKGNPVTWLCGDYFYYVFRQNVNADFYWLIEPDVYLNFEHLSRFFEKFEGNTDDALLLYYNELKNVEPASWHASMQYFLGEEYNVYKCLFPLHRLSGDAIDHCFNERQKISKHWYDKNWLGGNNTPEDLKKFPNDEAFIATTLAYSGKKISKLESVDPDAFSEFWFRPFRTKPNKDRSIYTNKLFHPVKQNDIIIEEVSKKIINHINKEKLLKELLPDSGDINAITNGISENIRKHIENFINIRVKANLLKENLKSLIREIVRINELKIWVYNENTLVIDLPIENKAIAFDFIIKDENNIELMLFNRRDNFTLSADLVKTLNLTRSQKDKKESYTKKFTHKGLSDLSKLSKIIFDMFIQVHKELSNK